MFRLPSFLVLTAALAACSPALQGNAAPAGRMVAPLLLTPDAKDNRSYAQPELARVTHVALDLAADFQAKRLGGTATLDLDAAPGAREIVLDNKGLVISGITDGRGRELPYTEGDADPDMGSPLTVTVNGARRIGVTY